MELLAVDDHIDISRRQRSSPRPRHHEGIERSTPGANKTTWRPEYVKPASSGLRDSEIAMGERSGWSMQRTAHWRSFAAVAQLSGASDRTASHPSGVHQGPAITRPRTVADGDILHRVRWPQDRVPARRESNNGCVVTLQRWRYQRCLDLQPGVCARSSERSTDANGLHERQGSVSHTASPVSFLVYGMGSTMATSGVVELCTACAAPASVGMVPASL